MFHLVQRLLGNLDQPIDYDAIFHKIQYDYVTGDNYYLILVNQVIS